MNKELKTFIIKLIALGALIFLTRAVFQFPVNFLGLDMFKEYAFDRVFSKIDALKVLTVAAVFFTLYYKERISQIRHTKLNVANALLCVFIGELLVCSYYGIRYISNLYDITAGLLLGVVIVVKAVLFLAIFVCFVIAVFQKIYLIRFYEAFRKELTITAAASVVGYFVLMIFQKQWLIFSNYVTVALLTLLGPFYRLDYASLENGTPLILVEELTLSIGPPCSGIDSMLLFVIMYGALFALDHARIRKGIYAISFIVGVAGVVLVNILRLYLLVLVGVHISPEIALGLFHTNAGWLLFVGYFLIYYWFLRRYIYERRPIR